MVIFLVCVLMEMCIFFFLADCSPRHSRICDMASQNSTGKPALISPFQRRDKTLARSRKPIAG